MAGAAVSYGLRKLVDIPILRRPRVRTVPVKVEALPEIEK